MANMDSKITPSLPNSQESNSTTLSEYLHSEFETIIAHKSVKHPRDKIQVTQRMKDFLLHPNGRSDKLPITSNDNDDMFSPIVSDAHITFEKNNIAKEHYADFARQTSSVKNYIMTSGIQLPVLDWQTHFRKGYSMLMWVRFHLDHSTVSRGAGGEEKSSSGTSTTNSDTADPWANEGVEGEPQILYRFATSASPNALGIQATLTRDTSIERNDDSDNIPCLLRLETLRPGMPSRADASPNIYFNLFMTQVSIPCGKWVLIGVQHAFHYLKPPVVTVALNGVEFGRGELAYPTLGGELGSLMRDNFVLCNMPNSVSGNNRCQSSTTRLNIEKLDFAGFGIYNESIPVLLQGIIAEHGPSNSADGVIPVVPPVVQNSNAMITNAERRSMHKSSGTTPGPFGLSSNRSKDGASSSRNIGIPLCVGVVLSLDGDHQGELLIHRLLSKLVVGLNASRAVKVGHGRVLIPTSVGSSVGHTADSHRVGIAQPKERHSEASLTESSERNKRKSASLSKQVEPAEDNLKMAKCGGNISIFNATVEFMKLQQRYYSIGSNIVPTYDSPSTLSASPRPMSSFIDTYSSVDPMGYILQAFHLSLPPPGYAHKLQMKLYYESFDHLYDLLIYQKGSLAAHLIEMIAVNISLGGRMKDEILQSGTLHVLGSLLKRVLLRASRLGMFKMKPIQDNESLWQICASKEEPADELLDMHAIKQSSPSHVPELIVKACCSIVEACCGPPQDENKRWKRPPLPLYIRRASDIALTCVFGFAFDMDLWGNDVVACASLMQQVADRYCSSGLKISKCNEFTEKFDSGYGRLLRCEISVQYLLDIVRIRFGEYIIMSKEDVDIQRAKMSLSRSLSTLIYTMLKYSLSSNAVSQGEQDIIAAINILSDCQLGSIVSYAVLNALHDLLVYCEVFPTVTQAKDTVKTDTSGVISSILYNHVSRYLQYNNSDTFSKLKKTKSDIVARLVRYLTIGQFHDVVAPLLLSRTVFTGSNSAQFVDCDDEDLGPSEFHQLSLWKVLLALFTWLASTSGYEGEKAAQTAGNLFFESAKAGSLSRCLVAENLIQILKLLIPPLPTPTSAVSMNHAPNLSMTENHLAELFARTKANMYLVGGLTASLLSQKEPRNDGIHLSRDTLSSIFTFLTSLKTVAFYVLERKKTVITDHVPLPARHRATATNMRIKQDVKLALDTLPSVITALISLEEVLEWFRSRCRSFDQETWDLVSGLDLEPSYDEQMNFLHRSQKELCNLIGVLIFSAMINGGGEASTLVWRTVISTMESVKTCVINQLMEDKEENKAGSEILPLRKNLLCRLTSIVLDLVVSSQENSLNPWTSIELCSSVARLSDFVEEKNLFGLSVNLPRNEHKGLYSQERMSLDQVRLLYCFLKVLESGRENTGWCQLLLPKPPSRDVTNPIKEEINRPNSFNHYARELIEAFAAEENVSSTNFVDLQNLALKDEIYDISFMASRHEIVKTLVGPVPSSSLSSSKLLLPILQPSLRLILGCLQYIRGVSVIIHNTREGLGKHSDTIFSVVAKELGDTLTAAIVGLTFPNARDICLNTLSVLQKCIEMKDAQKDDVAAGAYRKLSLTAIHEMCIRYEGERIKRKVAKLEAYENNNHSKVAMENEAANSSQIEALLLGDSLIGNNGNGTINETETLLDMSEFDDFILFPDGKQLEAKTNSPTSTNPSAVLGWNSYKGFGQALEKCYNQGKGSDNIKDTSDAAFLVLSKYLEAWNARQLIEDEESELVDLFDVNTSPETRYSNSWKSNLKFVNAADSMTFFIELSSTESSRRNEIQSVILPSKRYNSASYAQNFGWKTFMEVMISNGYVNFNDVFERCMADGSRDYGGRLVSVPVHPQFARIIPKQLDHSDLNMNRTETDYDNDIDLHRLNSLVQKGSLKIFDITKKEIKNIIEAADETDSLDGSNVIVSKPLIDLESMVLEDSIGADETFVDYAIERDQEINQDVILSNHDNESDDESVKKEDISMEIPSANNMDSNESLYNLTISAFSSPPNTSSSSLQGDNKKIYSVNAQTAGGNNSSTNIHVENCVHIKAEGNRKCTLFVTSTFLTLQYDDTTGLYEGEEMAINELKKKLDNDDENRDTSSNEIDYESIIQLYKKNAAHRPRSIRWNIHEISHIYLRRYRLRDSSLEMFFIPSGGDTTGGPGLLSGMNSLFLDFGPGNEGHQLRDEAANAIMSRAPTSAVKQWPDKSAQFLHEQLRSTTVGWVRGRVSNFEYLLALNCLAGRSFNDLCQYPVFPWVLSNYKSKEIPDLQDKANYRDLSKPMGALNPDRLKEFIERFQTFDDPVIPPFMYGSHYSTSAGVVLHFLVRMHPFASLHRQLQGGHFDVADRLFSSVTRTWDMCTGQSAAEVKELTPEWYCNPSFLRNANNFKLGMSQDGDRLGDVELPPWADGSPEKFVEVLRCALESDICTSMLPDWIDLIFGRKQQGPEAVEANNVFFYLTYYGSCDVSSIEDEDLRIATELQIAHFGQCPMQLFWRPHLHQLPRTSARRIISLSEMLGVFDLAAANSFTNANRQLPFESAPISHWVHLIAPPPGPHAPLISVRLVFPDRCIAIDAQGIYHFFRWVWRAESEEKNERPMKKIDLFSDKGYFVAQRELPHFRSVPRLPLKRHKPSSWKCRDDYAVVALSKCLFAGRSLLAISDGDGKGGLCFQLIDPSKCNIQGEVYVPSVHSSRISAIHMDPFGVAAGFGGVGGELSIVASEDGTASLWRFISNRSYHLPLRPRQRFAGHRGHKIRSVAVNSGLNLCATVSAFRCCIFNITSGAMLQSIVPPKDGIADSLGITDTNVIIEMQFIDSNAICITSSGYIVLVCETEIKSTENDIQRQITTLQLFTLEGIHIGSKAFESWRGVPQKISSTYDGRAVMVCSGRGISFHLVSPIMPLHFIDEWQIGGDEDDLLFAHDIDFGPSPSRPIVAVAGLSSGALRIHALKGISAWSEENKKGTVTEAVGSVIGTVKGTGNKVVGLVKGTGSRVLGFGKELGREALGDIASRGVSGFLGGLGIGKSNPEV